MSDDKSSWIAIAALAAAGAAAWAAWPSSKPEATWRRLVKYKQSTGCDFPQSKDPETGECRVVQLKTVRALEPQEPPSANALLVSIGLVAGLVLIARNKS